MNPNDFFPMELAPYRAFLAARKKISLGIMCGAAMAISASAVSIQCQRQQVGS
jgi:hypothetical protein